MTSTTPPADYLAALPPAIQAELADIARAAIGMTGEEKGWAAAIFATVGLHFGLKDRPDEALPGAHMVTALGLILRLANDEATGTNERKAR